MKEEKEGSRKKGRREEGEGRRKRKKGGEERKVWRVLQ